MCSLLLCELCVNQTPNTKHQTPNNKQQTINNKPQTTNIPKKIPNNVFFIKYFISFAAPISSLLLRIYLMMDLGVLAIVKTLSPKN
jgi:hypothetical protein